MVINLQFSHSCNEETLIVWYVGVKTKLMLRDVYNVPMTL